MYTLPAPGRCGIVIYATGNHKYAACLDDTEFKLRGLLTGHISTSTNVSRQCKRCAYVQHSIQRHAMDALDLHIETDLCSLWWCLDSEATILVI